MNIIQKRVPWLPQSSIFLQLGFRDNTPLSVTLPLNANRTENSPEWFQKHRWARYVTSHFVVWHSQCDRLYCYKVHQLLQVWQVLCQTCNIWHTFYWQSVTRCNTWLTFHKFLSHLTDFVPNETLCIKHLSHFVINL